ncbi:hypothetical protein [Methylobacterium sp. J-077]|uniref:hypothetical protein n=1 Tax=Methylobacterium sp. J-077 TaxID=2836656 RepID=UPI001FBA3772|nr:hypothetical protein [Methylobacterium sp. J-077]MCJ2124904.1 hypothetical protein [Methylobacterium sp. J-077]
MSQAQLAALADRIQDAWENGRICALVGRGCRARIVRIARLLDAGRIDTDRALRLAMEAEGAAFCFLPLPPEGDR